MFSSSSRWGIGSAVCEHTPRGLAISRRSENRRRLNTPNPFFWGKTTDENRCAFSGVFFSFLRMREMEEKIQETIHTLESQFTGDEAHDLEIVRHYLGTLDRTEANIPLVKALGAYCVQKFPNSEIVQSAKQIEEAFDYFHSRVREAQTCLKEKKYEDAVAIYREIIGKSKVERSDGDVLKFAFTHPFEEMIYRMDTEETRKIERISALPVLLYYELGIALFELQRYDEAKEAYNAALALNPVNPLPHYELIQIAKLTGDLDSIREILAKVHRYLFTRPQLARFYREQAQLAIFEEKYDLAVTLVYISMDYDDCGQARAQLNALAKHKGTDLSRPKANDAKARLEAEKIPVGPYAPIYESAMQIGAQTRQKYPEIAKMAYGIAYDLTHFKPIGDILAQMG